MAGDWIKVQKITPDKPEMRTIARLCGVSRGDAFLAWFRLWSHFDDMVKDGCLEGFTSEDADEMGRLQGLGAALEQVGWLIFEPHACSIHSWDTHNGRSAKARILANRRQAKWRVVDGQPSTGPSPR